MAQAFIRYIFLCNLTLYFDQVEKESKRTTARNHLFGHPIGIQEKAVCCLGLKPVMGDHFRLNMGHK